MVGYEEVSLGPDFGWHGLPDIEPVSAFTRIYHGKIGFDWR
jgi:hypothetical protein